ncbi:hypothetical protein [Hymenobacter nivis]|uniref:hypothetical protein n=1 Tax=Hymenobacter nivis TaxID=1850093 RepID=UPI0013A58DA7|nr:hypothetical protein [Hymenobacter nivis]
MNNLYEVAGYIANPSRNLLIEAEVSEDKFDAFNDEYEKMTGVRLLTNSPFVHLIPGGITGKWGVELRIYYVDNGNPPAELSAIAQANTRPSKQQYSHRCDRGKELIKPLFKMGFVLGDIQNLTRIRARIAASRLADFSNGFNR